jgi:xanthine dehydrogenase accessory factor
MNDKKVLIRGGGDLASGTVARLHRIGFQVLITELYQPMVLRRKAAFAEAVYAGEVTVEGITARLADDFGEAQKFLEGGDIAVLRDPEGVVLKDFKPDVLIDGRVTKKPPDIGMEAAPLVIGLGPGFTAGVNCHAVIETLRGPYLGRVIWEGSAIKNTGIPAPVKGKDRERALRAPASGVLVAHAEIGDHLEEGDLVAEVDGKPIVAPFKGVLRGIVHEGLQVKRGLKIGDVDPRDDPALCALISDRSLAVAGGVLEAVLRVR